jgi:starvation-inducible DNA-binding protein
MSKELITNLNQCLANSFEMYQRAHGMHWNVEGMFFNQFHDFFGDVYGEIYGAIDKFAEEIRACDGYAIYGTAAFAKTNMLPESKMLTGTDVKSMLRELEMCNEIIIKCLSSCFDMATNERKHGLANFLADRMDAHAKHGWMIRSLLK